MLSFYGVIVRRSNDIEDEPTYSVALCVTGPRGYRLSSRPNNPRSPRLLQPIRTTNNDNQFCKTQPFSVVESGGRRVIPLSCKSSHKTDGAVYVMFFAPPQPLFQIFWIRYRVPELNGKTKPRLKPAEMVGEGRTSDFWKHKQQDKTHSNQNMGGGI